MLRLFERRPISALVPGSARTVGAPPVGHVPAASWAANQSGSTQISATHSAPAGAAGAGAGAGAGAAEGSWPVVKSYPQTSQNSASGRLMSPQFGHSSGGATTVGGSSDSDERGLLGAGSGSGGGEGSPPAGGAVASAIGSPHTAQKSLVAGEMPCGHRDTITSPW